MVKKFIEIEEDPQGFFQYVRLPVPRIFIPPKEIREYCRSARRRRLEMARSLLDYAIERLDETEQKSPRKTERVNIE